MILLLVGVGFLFWILPLYYLSKIAQHTRETRDAVRVLTGGRTT